MKIFDLFRSKKSRQVDVSDSKYDDLFLSKAAVKRVERERVDSVKRAEITLSAVDTFTIPDVSKIREYMALFRVLLSSDLSKTFEIVKFIKQKSANGLIYVVRLKQSKSKYSKLLIKVQKTQFSDPPSYEYYIGKTLNTLRAMNVSNFGLVYGRFRCGFNESERSICERSPEEKTHVLYEYITSLSDKTITLEDYIMSDRIHPERGRKTVNLINILIVLMISLQKAQDHLQFTHYDLHMANVLLVELNAAYSFTYEYKGKTYNVVLDYFPFIIDYGRSHIDPKLVDEAVQEPIIDTDTDVKYPDFATYQSEVWKDRRFDMYDERGMIRLIRRRLEDGRVVKRLQTILNTNDVTIDAVIDKFYRDSTGETTYGITPDKYNPYYDHCKLIRYVSETVVERDLARQDFGDTVFTKLLNEIDDTFPFYYPDFYGVCDTYYDFGGLLRRPIDVVEYLYLDNYEQLLGSEQKYTDLSFSQLGGNTEDYYKRVYSQLRKRVTK